MGRLLVLVLLVVAAVWLIRRAFRSSLKGSQTETEVPKQTDELVSCAHCGVLLPRAEARAAAGALYCTEEHARLGPGQR